MSPPKKSYISKRIVKRIELSALFYIDAMLDYVPIYRGLKLLFIVGKIIKNILSLSTKQVKPCLWTVSNSPRAVACLRAGVMQASIGLSRKWHKVKLSYDTLTKKILMENKRKILVTSALPYANGPIHIGHLVEYIQTDIWVRFQKLRANTCHYVCADDAHGTPIMLRAQQENISPQELIDNMNLEHQRDFAGFNIQFDNYHSTHSEENRTFIETIYKSAKDKGHIRLKTIKQAYDAEANTFLPDRFIKGECPNCHAKDQYGDNCEVCGSTYSSTELINPISTITGSIPVEKETDHYFFNVNDFKEQLQAFLATGAVQKEIANKMLEWFEDDLKEWDITRDKPYWGFKIPDTEDKYFYVWLDAPMGYMSSFKNLCDKKDINFDEYWGKDSSTELYHFIGKDIAYFHTLFWPAVLEAGNYRLPTSVFCHGFLTVNGLKMSKSRGTFIQADCYLRHLPPEALRYYFAAKLNNSIGDLDLNLKDFLLRINSDLIGKVVNIASRCAGFINKNFDQKLSVEIHDVELLDQFINVSDTIAELYENRQFSRAMREIMSLADIANQYIDEHKPWVLIKDEERREDVQKICSQGINLYRILIIYLKPVLPQLAQDSEDFLNDQDLEWIDLKKPLQNHHLNEFKPLMQRVEQASIDAMLADNSEILSEHLNKNKPSKEEESPPQGIISVIQFSDFEKVDLRVVKIIQVNAVKGSSKLLRIVVDLGNETKTVLAGIKASYSPEVLNGEMAILVANLAPRKMQLGTSEGMLLATHTENGEVRLLQPNPDSIIGSKVE